VNKKGVTLIELIVVMVIIAIGAVLMAPNMGTWMANYRLRSTTRDIVSTMRTAQMKAVSNNTDYQVSFTPGAGSYILQYRNTGGTFVNEGAAQTLPSGIQFTTNFADNKALFNPNSSSNGGSVFLQNSKGTQRRITVLPTTGRIAIK
jgi:prepilin-type N-terminal cleavage/methylation domain-containing protein